MYIHSFTTRVHTHSYIHIPTHLSHASTRTQRASKDEQTERASKFACDARRRASSICRVSEHQHDISRERAMHGGGHRLYVGCQNVNMIYHVECQNINIYTHFRVSQSIGNTVRCVFSKTQRTVFPMYSEGKMQHTVFPIYPDTLKCVYVLMF